MEAGKTNYWGDEVGLFVWSTRRMSACCVERSAPLEVFEYATRETAGNGHQFTATERSWTG